MLRRSPGFAAAAVLTLALGIGANTAIFSLVNAVLLRSLAVADPDRLVQVSYENGVVSYPEYRDLRDHNTVFDGLAAWGGITASLNTGGETDLATGVIVTGNYFEVLGVRPALGRLLAPSDDVTPGAHPVTVLGHAFWRRRFDARPEVIGTEVLLSGHRFTIVGVTAEGFTGAELGVVRNIYVPMMMQAVVRPPRAGYSGEMNPDLLGNPGNRWLRGVGRLKPGVAPQQAASALTLLAAAMGPPRVAGAPPRAMTAVPVNVGDATVRARLSAVAALLMSVVATVLLLACANVANLMLSRAASRRREIAVRLALGASRGRLVSQLLTESVLVSVLGGAAGLLLAFWIMRRVPSRAATAGSDPHHHRRHHRPAGPRLHPLPVAPGRCRVRPGAGAQRVEAEPRARAQGRVVRGRRARAAVQPPQRPRRLAGRALARAAGRLRPLPAQPARGAKGPPRLRRGAADVGPASDQPPPVHEDAGTRLLPHDRRARGERAGCRVRLARARSGPGGRGPRDQPARGRSGGTHRSVP